MSAYLRWEVEGKDWPNREASRFVDAFNMRWHVQVMGEGPAVLLLHGTGASSHSWRDVMPLLAKDFKVVVPDLPGHGFTSKPSRGSQTLPGMAMAVGALLKELGLSPERAAGHSAGSAVLVRMAADRIISPGSIISFNGAFFPVSGVAGQFFSPLAKAAASSSFMSRLFAAMADQKAVERLLKDTGSTLDATGMQLYQRLFSNEAHVAGTLGMMAAWDLHWVESDLRRLNSFLYLVKASNDRTIPPVTADRAARLARQSAVISLVGLGHLAHEEKPALAADVISEPENFVSSKARAHHP
jgi:magnesium chelatase accessory protein